MNTSNIRPLLLKLWPVVAGIGWAIYHWYLNEPTSGVAGLVTGILAALSGDSLHREPIPVIVPVVAQTPLVQPHAIVSPPTQGEASLRKDRPS